MFLYFLKAMNNVYSLDFYRMNMLSWILKKFQ